MTSQSAGVTFNNPVTFNASTFTFGGPSNTTNGSNPLTFTAAVTLTNGSANTIVLPNGSQTTTFAGPMSGSGSLILTGQGTLSLTANNTNTGGVTIAGGMIDLNGPTGAFSSLTAANGITIQTGGTLKIDNSGPAANNNTNRIADVAPRDAPPAARSSSWATTRSQRARRSARCHSRTGSRAST